MTYTDEKGKPLNLTTRFQLLRLGKNKINGDETVVLRNEPGDRWDNSDHERQFDSQEEAMTYAHEHKEWHDVEFTVLPVHIIRNW